MELSPKLAELTPKAMEITPQALEIVTGRSERLNNRAANAYVVSGKGLSARRSPANEGTYFFIRFWVGKVNSCASVTAPLLSVAKHGIAPGLFSTSCLHEWWPCTLSDPRQAYRLSEPQVKSKYVSCRSFPLLSE